MYFNSVSVQVVPHLFAEVFKEKLSTVNTIQVIGNNWTVSYDDVHGCVQNLCSMLSFFRVIWKETLVFQADSTNVIRARIYQNNGKEIDYVSRMFGILQKNLLCGCGIQFGKMTVWKYDFFFYLFHFRLHNW